MKKGVLLAAVALICGLHMVFAGPQGPALKGRDPDTLVFVLAGLPQPIDPNIYNSLNEAQVIRNVYEPLIGMDSEGKFAAVLAERLPTIENGGISKDGSAYTFTLRKDIRFHNGNPLTADDVVYSFNRILHHPKSTTKSIFAAIMAVEKIDTLTVRIRFGKLKDAESATVSLKTWEDRAKYMVPAPYGVGLSILAHFSASIVDKETVEAAGADYGTKIVIGTGPYQFVSWPNPQEVNITRNDSWWRGAENVAFKNVRFKTITEQAQVNNVLITGEADLSYNLSRLDFQPLEKAGVTITRKPGVQLLYGVFNMKSPFVGQLRDNKLDLSGRYETQDSTNLRLAIFYSINPVPLIRQVDIFNGAGLPASQMMQNGLLGFVEGSPAGTPLAEYNEKSWYFNPAKAKAHFGMLSAEFKAKLAPGCITMVVGNLTDRVKVANNIKDQVKTILGTDLIQVIPMIATQIPQMAKTGEGYDMAVVATLSATMDPDSTCIIVNGQSLGTGTNGAQYNNDLVNGEIIRGRHSIDVKVREDAYRKIQIQVMTDKAYFPLIVEQAIFGSHPRLGNLDKALLRSKYIDLYKLTKEF